MKGKHISRKSQRAIRRAAFPELNRVMLDLTPTAARPPALIGLSDQQIEAAALLRAKLERWGSRSGLAVQRIYNCDVLAVFAIAQLARAFALAKCDLISKGTPYASAKRQAALVAKKAHDSFCWENLSGFDNQAYWARFHIDHPFYVA